MYGSVRGRAWRADVVVVLVVCTLSRPAHAQGSCPMFCSGDADCAPCGARCSALSMMCHAETPDPVAPCTDIGARCNPVSHEHGCCGECDFGTARCVARKCRARNKYDTADDVAPTGGWLDTTTAMEGTGSVFLPWGAGYAKDPAPLARNHVPVTLSTWAAGSSYAVGMFRTGSMVTVGNRGQNTWLPYIAVSVKGTRDTKFLLVSDRSQTFALEISFGAGGSTVLSTDQGAFVSNTGIVVPAETWHRVEIAINYLDAVIAVTITSSDGTVLGSYATAPSAYPRGAGVDNVQYYVQSAAGGTNPFFGDGVWVDDFATECGGCTMPQGACTADADCCSGYCNGGVCGVRLWGVVDGDVPPSASVSASPSTPTAAARPDSWAGAPGAASADMVGAAAYISTVTAALNDCAGKADGATCTLTFTMTRRDKSGESSSVACSGDLPISRGTNFTCTESSGLEVASLEWWTWVGGWVLLGGGLIVLVAQSVI
eukprot:TRINITY_DN1088_c0_g2_i2.p1 TRINITY_DN1088_c0_g2~~TRINITY_DN1088_c0_g2_i2.p1  ORF type:complete len:486 (+),score=37.12 TRINITY_DN1088_c0_g2_i2:55-1512(+)